MKCWMQLGRTLTAVAGLAFSLAWLSVSARAADSTDGWARFRGPNGSGLVETPGLPATWAESDYRWKVDLPGAGHSAPVIWGARLFVTSGDEETGTRFVRCLNTADGATLWSREFTAEAHKKHKFNSFASSTPAVDARHVYISWATPEQLVVAALDHDGKEIWKRDLGPYPGGHGSGSSPIVFDDLVILANDKAGPSFIVALDAASGADRWKLDRRGSRASYSTPCVYQPARQAPQLIFTEWEQGISGVDPKTGKLLWERDVFGEDEEKRSIGSPVIAGELVIGTCGFAKGKKFVVAVKPTASAANRTATSAADKLAEVQEVYRLDKISPHIPTPLVKGNKYLLTLRHLGVCSSK